MKTIIDFNEVSTQGLQSSPFAESLAGLRAHEARYFMNKYKHKFEVLPAIEGEDILNYIETILEQERDIKIESNPLEVTTFELEGIKFSYVFYESGLAINVMYTVADDSKRAVGFKLCEGMDIPKELEEKFKFARQKSKLAGTIRGSFFKIKGEY